VTGKTHYQVLDVDPSAGEDEIKKAYKRLARIYHPDLNPKRPRSAEDRFKQLQAAYDVLSDPALREEYDRSLGIGHQAAPPSFAQAHVTTDPVPAEVAVRGPRTGWLSNIALSRKLAMAAWALCLLGSFLPTSYAVVFSLRGDSFYAVPFVWTLIWITVPLIMIWLGSWLSEGESLDMSLGSVLKEGFGRLLQVLGWIYFARLIGLMFLGPLALLFS
jgi:DnaJ domain